MSDAPERLNRYLARRGVASRRGADALIADGRVSINGIVAVIGSVVSEGDVVTVDGDRPLATTTTARTVMLNKPAGVVSTRRDPQRRRTVMHLAPRVPGLVPVGRLDTDSRGLLLLSTDGELTHRLTHPRWGVTKTYHVTVSPEPREDQVQRLRAGVELNDGDARAVAAGRIDHARDHLLEIVMGEGRKREVRRMCMAVGLDVVDLRRVAFGPLRLGDLAEGRHRELGDDEITALYGAVHLPVPARLLQSPSA